MHWTASRAQRLRIALIATFLTISLAMLLAGVATQTAIAALGSAEVISAAEEVLADSVIVDIDSDGLATAIWSGQAGSPPTVGLLARTRSGDSGWQAPVDISGGTSIFQFDADVGDDGRAIVAWEAANRAIYAAYRSNAGIWAAPVLLKSAESGSLQPGVRAAIDASGNAVVAWRFDDAVPPELSAYARYRSVTTGNWSAVDNISGSINIGGNAIDVVAAGDDSFVAVWHELGTPYRVGTATRPAGDASSWSEPETDLTSETSPTGQPAIAADAHGNVAIAWRQYVPIADPCPPCSVYELWTAYRPAGGAWGAAEVASGADTEVGVSGKPALAFDYAGNLRAVWANGAITDDQLRTATRTPAGVWSTPETIDQDGTTISTLALGVDALGNSTLLWRSQNASNTYRIELSTRPSSGSWTAAATQAESLSPYVSSNFPSVGAAGDGGAVAAWNSQAVSGTPPTLAFARYSKPTAPTPPVVTITSPVDGGTTTASSVTLNFTATDGSGPPSCDATDGDSVPLAMGSNTITVSCTDNVGTVGSDTVTVTRTVVPDTTPPVVTITAPLNGATTTASSVILNFTATDDGATVPTCSATNGDSIPLLLGGNTITVSCSDDASNQAASSVTVTRVALPPPPTVGSLTISRATVSPSKAYRKARVPGSKKKRKTASRLRFTISDAAAVKVEFQLKTKGRRSGKKCVRQTGKNKRKRACTYYKTSKRLTRNVSAGTSTIKFSTKRFKKGTYRVVLSGLSSSGAEAKPVLKKLTVR